VALFCSTRRRRGPSLKRAPPSVSHLFCSKLAYLSGIGRKRLPACPNSAGSAT
jgi:hypothetical protein